MPAQLMIATCMAASFAVTPPTSGWHGCNITTGPDLRFETAEQCQIAVTRGGPSLHVPPDQVVFLFCVHAPAQGDPA